MIRSGRLPAGPDDVVIDQATADQHGIAIGDQVEIAAARGVATYTVVGLSGLGNADGFGGATVVAWDLPTAMDVLETDGMIDGVDIVLADGASAEEVTTWLQSVIAPTMEVVTGEQLAEETKDAVGTIIGYIQSGLLAFAFITLFVATFIINNTFAITIGQRMRELALLRAIGASGKQVKRLIVREAMILAAIASVIGIAAGFGVSRLLIWIFNRAGAGFPGTESIIKPRTVIIALAVGLGVTFASVIVPSRKAAKIPPVAAMRARSSDSRR
ncbi:MAG: FtsX-like permease family protein [Ilumatobacteraceae bacterium]